MSMTDPIADMLTRIRNGIQSHHERVELPASKLKVEIARILKNEGFIRNYNLSEEGRAPGHAPRSTSSTRPSGEPVIHGIERISRPGRRVYRNKQEIPSVLGGLGLAIVSTSKGVLSGTRSRQERRRRRSPLPGLVRRDPCHALERKEIPLPKGVEVKHDGNAVTVKGPKGTPDHPARPRHRRDDREQRRAVHARRTMKADSRAFHGLMRALVANNVRGVTEGFKRELDIVGVGYRAEVKGKEVVFPLGYSHPVRFPIPEGIDIAVEAEDRPHHHHRHRQAESRTDRRRDPRAARARSVQGQRHQVLRRSDSPQGG